MIARNARAAKPVRTGARRIGFWLSRLLLVLLLVVSATLVAVFTLEQAFLRPLLEFAVEKTTNRVFRIEGELEANAGRSISLRAERISMANAEWGSREKSLEVGKLLVSIDLLPILTGKLVVDDLAVSGVKLLVEEDEQGQSNWIMGSSDPAADSEDATEQDPVQTSPPPATGENPEMTLQVVQSQLSDIEVSITNASLPQPISIRLDTAGHRAETEKELSATAVGAIQDRPFDLRASVGPVAQLIAAGAVDFEINADFESIALKASGHVDQLLTPRQATVQLSLTSPEISAVFATFGLPAIVSGKTELQASMLPSGEEHQVELAASVDSLKLDATANLQRLDSFDEASIALAASGPDLSTVAKLAGINKLPKQPFELESRLMLSGQVLTIADTRFVSGSSHLSVDGSMNQFPKLEGTNLKIQLDGDNYLDYAGLLGMQNIDSYDPEPFAANADFTQVEKGQQKLAVELTIADVKGNLSGMLTGNPEYLDSRLEFQLTGKNDQLLQRLLMRPTLVEGDYSLNGSIRRSETGYDLDSMKMSVGENRLQLSGTIGNNPLQADSRLSVQFDGPDLNKLAAIAGYTGFLPAGVADIDTTLSTRDGIILLDEASAQLGKTNLQASGQIGLTERGNGSQVEITLSGADIIDVLPPEYHGYVVPQQSFEVAGSVAMSDDRLAIRKLQARLGQLQLEASGSVSTQNPLIDSTLKLNLGGPDLAAIFPEDLLDYRLPAAQFSIDGELGFTEKGLQLDDVKSRIGSDSIELSGLIPLGTPTEGLNLVISASGPNLAEIIPIEPERIDFADQPYDLAGEIELAGGIATLRQLEFSIPPNRLAGELRISMENPLQFGQFDLKANGENLADFVPATPRYTPAEVPFDLDARGSWDNEIVRVERGVLKLDNSNVEVQGEIDLPPGMASTQLELSIQGDSLADFGQFKGLIMPPDQFHIDAKLQGDTEGLEIPEFELRIGESDMRGALDIIFAEKPDVRIKLESSLFDLAKLIPPEDETAEGESSPEPAPASNDGRVIPDVPVRAARLNSINLETQIKMGELRLPHNTLRNIQFDSTLRDGDLTVTRLSATATQGQLNANFRATADGDRITTKGKLEGRNIVLGTQESSDGESLNPEMDIDLEFSTEGATLRDLGGNLNGYLHLGGGKGRLQNSLALGLFGSFFTELFSAVNPFATREPYTSISCFGAYAEITDGVATISPAAVLQTDKLDMFSVGQIDLNTEQIGLRFETSPRSGLGISVGSFINPFVGVSGTLANPGLGVDPENAMFQGGFAIATGGLSIVAKSLFNRWFDDSNHCQQLDEEAKKMLAERKAAEQPESTEENQ